MISEGRFLFDPCLAISRASGGHGRFPLWSHQTGPTRLVPPPPPRSVPLWGLVPPDWSHPDRSHGPRRFDPLDTLRHSLHWMEARDRRRLRGLVDDAGIVTRCNAGVERPIQVSQGGGHGAAGARCGCQEEDRPHLFTVGEFLDKVVRPIYEDTHGRVRNVRASRFLPPASAALLCSSPVCAPLPCVIRTGRSYICAARFVALCRRPPRLRPPPRPPPPPPPRLAAGRVGLRRVEGRQVDPLLSRV